MTAWIAAKKPINKHDPLKQIPTTWRRSAMLFEGKKTRRISTILCSSGVHRGEDAEAEARYLGPRKTHPWTSENHQEAVRSRVKRKKIVKNRVIHWFLKHSPDSPEALAAPPALRFPGGASARAPPAPVTNRPGQSATRWPSPYGPHLGLSSTRSQRPLAPSGARVSSVSLCSNVRRAARRFGPTRSSAKLSARQRAPDKDAKQQQQQ